MKLLKHPNNTDVAMEVISQDLDPDTNKWSILVRWWNIGNCHAPWCMNLLQELTLTDSKLKEFKEYDSWKR